MNIIKKVVGILLVLPIILFFVIVLAAADYKLRLVLGGAAMVALATTAGISLLSSE